MCGIVGYLNLDGSPVQENVQVIESQVIQSMCDSIFHRGPDSQGHMLKGPVALGMRRLSIIDVASGDQPIHNEDASISIVFNGEIYNFHELQKIVLDRGHKLVTNSDTEVIVHLYEEFGVDCLAYLEGMFGFAIWDHNKQRLFIARDRMGEKPMHWAIAGNYFLFGSELKGILAHPAYKKAPNFAAMQNYLALEYVPSPLTLFDGINKLMPAHYMVVEGGKVNIACYWRPDFEPLDITESEAEAELVRLLDRSTELRLISDVPLGVFLSGGIDSSGVAALAAKHVSGALKTFSIGFDDPSFDESAHAYSVAKHLGTEHHVSTFNPDMALELLQELWTKLDEPLADASIIPTYFLSKVTRKQVTVALSGDAGDELFGGYPTYMAHRIASVYNNIPQMLTKNIVRPLVNNLPVSLNNLSFDYKAKRFIGSVHEEPICRHLRWMGAIDYQNQLALLDSRVKVLSSESDIRPGFGHPLYPEKINGDLVNSIMRLDQTTYLSEDLLVKSDRASMAASLEVRVPFLAYPLVEFALKMPSSLKLKGRKTKYILRKAVTPYLPEDILKRPKKGFGIPVAKWLQKDFRPLINELLGEKFVRSQGIFNEEALNALVSEHMNFKKDRRKELWTLLMFQMWWQKYFV